MQVVVQAVAERVVAVLAAVVLATGLAVGIAVVVNMAREGVARAEEETAVVKGVAEAAGGERVPRAADMRPSAPLASRDIYSTSAVRF